MSPGVSFRLTPQCLRRTRPPLWARRRQHFPGYSGMEGRGEGGLAVAKPGRIGSDSVEDSYSVETWLNTGQLRGHSVDWKGLRVGWRGSPFRIRTIGKGQAG